jgi:hypothetical protein
MKRRKSMAGRWIDDVWSRPEHPRPLPFKRPICAGSFPAKNPSPLAMARPVQWMTAPGGSRRVRSTTACILACDTGGMPSGRVLSRHRPSMPSWVKRCCQAPHHRPADASPIGNLQHRQALGGQQDDLRPLNVFRRAPSVLDDSFQVRAMLSREEKRDGLSHSSRLARLCASVNPPFASMH